MRIAIDGTAPVVGGGVTYLRDLMPALCAASPSDAFHLFLRADMPPYVTGAANCTCIAVRFPHRGHVMWRVVWQQLILPVRLLLMKADVVLCPYDSASLLAPCRVVLGIQNARPYGGPPAPTWRERVRHRILRTLTRVSVWRAAGVFFVSEWSRQAIGRALGVPPEKSCVIPLGVSDRFRPPTGTSTAASTGPDVLVVGSLASHKDSLTLFDAWARVLAAHGARVRMHVVGPVADPPQWARVRSLASPLARTGAVTFAPEASPDELVQLYQHAAILVLPSWVESFGLPLLEAMACGTAVIASDIPTAREICGDAAWYYRPGDPADLAAKLTRLLADARARGRLAEIGSVRARRFPWGRTAGLTLRLLKGGSLAASSEASVKAGAT